MKTISQTIIRKPLNIFLLAFPLALMAYYGDWGNIWVFAFSAVGVVPMAGYIGRATESLVVYTGPKIGGLLNATLGNAAELMITLAAVRAGLLELVKASITGSILGNLLLVLGFAMLLGGLKNGILKFGKSQATNHALLLTLATLALIFPSLFSHSVGLEINPRVETLNLGAATVMLILYILGLIYTLKTLSSPFSYAPGKHEKPEWSIKMALIILALFTGGIICLSELLVGVVEYVVVTLGLSEFFLGIILILIVGNAAEYFVAVMVARRNQMDLSGEIALTSSLQIALLAAPLLVFVSLWMGHILTLKYNRF
jgi:Ca2+:H+ antiporter